MNARTQFHRGAAICALLFSAFFILSSFSGCIGAGPAETAAFIEKPDSFALQKLDLSNPAKIRLSEECYAGLPIISSLFASYGINITVGWGDGTDVSFTEISEFSSRIAISFWNSSSEAIVVDGYENAIVASSYAALFNIPILVSGNTTDEALFRLGCTNPENIIAIGGVKYANNPGVRWMDKKMMVDYTVDVCAKSGKSVDYLILTNISDWNTTTPHISCVSSLFAAYHGATILNYEGTEKAVYRIREIAERQAQAGSPLKYLLLVGGAKSIDFIYKDFQNTVGSTPSDKLYSDLDMDPMTMELAMGRIFAKTIADASKYFDRIWNYKSYLATAKTPSDNTIPLLGNEWNNNALTYFGLGTDYMCLGSETAINQMFRDSRFNTQDDSAYGHTSCGLWGDVTYISGPALAADFAKCNFIAIDADHGSTTWCSVNSSTLQQMHPGVAAAASCLLGMIDNGPGKDIDKNTSFSYTMLEKGINAFIAPTRSTFGNLFELPSTPATPYESQSRDCSPALVHAFYNYLISENLTTGEAFQKACNWYYANCSTLYVEWQYQHYGDPKFNPYEPCNEGK
jgi:hypothetical protein